MALDTVDSTADILTIPTASMSLPSRATSRADEEETYIIFAAEDSDGSIYPWSVSVDGDAQKMSNETLPATPLKFLNSYAGSAFFLSEDNLYQVSSSGSSTLIDLPSYAPVTSDAYVYRSSMQLNPGEEGYIVYVGLSDSDSLRPMFTKPDTGETCIFYDSSTYNDFDFLEIGIARQNKVVMVGQLLDEDTYKVITFDLSDAISDTGPSPLGDYDLCYADFNVELESDNQLGHLLPNQVQFEDIYLVADVDGVYQLISVPKDGDGVSFTQHTNFPFDVRNPVTVGDGASGVIFELALSDSQRLGCFYSIGREQTTCFSKGSKFSPLLSDFNLVPYVDRVNGYHQMGIRDVSTFLSTPESLSVYPETATVPIDHTQDFVASGGTPPYSYAVEAISGNGSILDVTGRLTASQQGTLNVIATDAAGDTATAVVTVPESGSLIDDYGDEGFAELPNLTIAGNALAEQTDSKLVVAGAVGTKAFVARLESDGSLDTDWNDVGYTLTSIGTQAEANAVTLDDSDNIVIAGTTWNGVDFDFFVARYSTDGELDFSFSDDGIVTLDFCGDADQAYDVATDNDGRIVVAGSATCGADTNSAFARLTSTGELDEEFGTGGVATINVSKGYTDEVYAIGVETDNKIVGAGKMNPDNISSNSIILSLEEDGSSNTDFNDDGIAILDFSSGTDLARDLLLDSNQIVIVGSAENMVSGKDELMISQLQLDSGNLYNDFGDGGVVLLAGPDGEALDAYSVKMLSGDYMIGARLGDAGNTQWALTSVDRVGDLKDTFGTDGFVTYTDGTAPNSLSAIEVIGELDKIFVLGGLNGDNNAGLAAFWP
jgi:uncharacterized delta-60 repeat protein